MSENQRMTTIRDLQDRGRALRKNVPRRNHGIWVPDPSRSDPILLLQEQDKNRLKHLLPIKYGRMLESPFTFMRGSAVVMASDLATTPVTGLQVQLCGDAHLLNFGIFATPERKLVFDINDFDETYPGPWEWDLKRLAASAVVAGRENGFEDDVNRKLAMVVSRYYRRAMVRFAQSAFLDVWYYNVEVEKVLEVFEKSSRKAGKSAQKVVKKARESTWEHAIEKLTEVVDGRRRIRNDPPLLARLSEILPEERKAEMTEQYVKKLYQDFVNTLPEERHHLVSHFRISDGALRVGGIGSIGTRCIIFLLEGTEKDEALILQLKEAGPSTLESYVEKKDSASQARRVVVGQKLMQAASDIFLGWIEDPATGIQYYWRQLKDMKGSFDVNSLDEAGLETYLKVCSVCLARAHARTGDAASISGYIGKSDTFCEAVTDFAVAYADQTERDYQALKEAVKSGRITAEKGI
ncbi:DUF2252 domain-containing protein [Methanosarcina sp. 2.H.A.1B.4]|uniref:DUF2252 domain-containing protein n=1 Tax=Methanosarcina sp. 2.H.A.1B.4 TaxID=1483600 RepID=UPI000B1EEB8D|nr:DUF2252 domain-containing protein [Methanosarcina sp. 2.H.A.1B.4]